MFRHLEDWFPVYVLVPILIWILWGYSGAKERAEKECAARGGVLIETRAKFLCVDPKALR